MNPLMPNEPEAAPASPQHSPEDISKSHDILDHYFNALVGLAGKPELTKKDIFGAAADLLGKGAFSAPEQQAAMMKQMMALPDDEQGLRAFVGQQILGVSEAKGHMETAFGPRIMPDAG